MTGSQTEVPRPIPRPRWRKKIKGYMPEEEIPPSARLIYIDEEAGALEKFFFLIDIDGQGNPR